MTTGKTIALTRQTFVAKVMSLLFNKLSRLVITFLPRSKRLLISWLQSPTAVILEAPKIVCHCFHCFPIYLPWSDGIRCHDLSFLNVEFQTNFFTVITRLFSSSSLSVIRVVSSAYLRLMIFLPAILITVCASSGPAYLMMYCAYKLNKQGGNIQPTLTYSFPNLEPVCFSMSSSSCCFLTCWISGLSVCNQSKIVIKLLQTSGAMGINKGNTEANMKLLL